MRTTAWYSSSMVLMKHGSEGMYRNGKCRCLNCQAWYEDWSIETARVAASKRKKRGLAPDDPRHGTASGYQNWSCRCEPCRMAQRDYTNKRKYGLSSEEVEGLLWSQGGVCASCGGLPTGSKVGWHIDHDHKTGRVRGVLCHGCNVALGLLKESPDSIRGLLAYIERNVSE